MTAGGSSGGVLEIESQSLAHLNYSIVAQTPLSAASPSYGTGAAPTSHSCQVEFEAVDGREVTDELLTECAHLFSEHYGVWAPNVEHPLVPGEETLLHLSSHLLKTFYRGTCQNVGEEAAERHVE